MILENSELETVFRLDSQKEIFTIAYKSYPPTDKVRVLEKLSAQFLYRCARNQRFLYEQRGQTYLFGKGLFNEGNLSLAVVSVF